MKEWKLKKPKGEDVAMRHKVHYRIKAPDSAEEYHVKVRRLHYPSHRAKWTLREKCQMQIVNFLRE